METPISYTLNKINIQKFINAIDEESVKKTIKILLNNTIHVSYDTFIIELTKHIPFILKLIPENRPIFVYIDKIDKIDKTDNDYYYNKSNYWLFVILKSYIPVNRDIKIIRELDNDNIQNGDFILLLDDCIYTGIQMSNTIYYMKNTYNKSLNFVIYVPYTSKAGLEKLKEVMNINKQLKLCKLIELPDSKRIIPFGNYITEEEAMELSDYYLHLNKEHILNSYPIYFDHKVAKYNSSFPYIYSGLVPNYYNQDIIKALLRYEVRLKDLNIELDELQEDIMVRLQWRFNKLHELEPSFELLDVKLSQKELTNKFIKLIKQTAGNKYSKIFINLLKEIDLLHQPKRKMRQNYMNNYVFFLHK